MTPPIPTARAYPGALNGYVGTTGDWIEVKCDRSRSCFVVKELATILPKDMRYSSFCNDQFGYDTIMKLSKIKEDNAAQEKYYQRITRGDAASISSAKHTRDVLEVWAYCSADHFPDKYRKWLHTLAFEGVKGLLAAYARTPKRFLRGSPVFENMTYD